MIRYIFFDLGSTLIDESKCIEYRICQLLTQPGAPDRENLEHRMAELASQNKLPYKDAAKEFGLETIKWPQQLERLYNGAAETLEKLKPRYHLGIIANQNPGTEERLKAYGIHHFFDVIIASAEAGLDKPDPEIFRLALREAGCMPDEAFMVGDRLDNDIAPAKKLGMKTVWVRQGYAIYQSIDDESTRPDYIVDSIEELVYMI